ncbi:MAG: hypothetical protein KDD50_06995 [Bdellovibrionales bacterium]|nr:hypothetical protein [Bdellovibrionales bacterium]
MNPIKKILTLSILTLMSSTTFASNDTNQNLPLLSKTLSPGFTRPEYRVFKKCEVYKDKIVILKGVDSLVVTETKSIELDGPIMNAIVNVALADKQRSPAPTDGPTTTYSVYSDDLSVGIPEEPRAQKQIHFKATGSMRLETNHPDAILLENFLNTVCD